MFVSVKFREADTRAYTYATELPLVPGDRVLVDVKGEQKVVHVAEIDLPEPNFACKPVIGMAPPKEEPAEETPASEEI